MGGRSAGDDVADGHEVVTPDGVTHIIRDVWADNLEDEFKIIREVVLTHPYVAMDTEFPGIVARPIMNTTENYAFQTLRCNVDVLKLIQVGLTFSDAEGNLAKSICTWQFNFKFDLSQDMYAINSIDMLTKAGIDFDAFSERGIEEHMFGELMISSGIVLNENVRWISFHSTYDFGYLLRVLSGGTLPTSENDFFDLLRLFFPKIYDIKYMLKSCKHVNVKSGLNDIADELAVPRIGPQHQAGSDSLLTCNTFFTLRSRFKEELADDSKYVGVIYGLGTSVSEVTSAVVLTPLQPIRTPPRTTTRTPLPITQSNGVSVNLFNVVTGKPNNLPSSTEEAKA